MAEYVSAESCQEDFRIDCVLTLFRLSRASSVVTIATPSLAWRVPVIATCWLVVVASSASLIGSGGAGTVFDSKV